MLHTCGTIVILIAVGICSSTWPLSAPSPFIRLHAYLFPEPTPVCARLSGSRIVSPNEYEKSTPDTTPQWHGKAALARRSGVDGIYIFNWRAPLRPSLR